METVSLVASVVSVIIGGFAIWLSVTFYRMSNRIGEDTKEAAKGISTSVTRLESLFDRLYSDTFSMMKDTVSDMRRHIWPEKEQSVEALEKIEEGADRKIEELRAQVTSELSSAMGSVGKTDTKISEVEERLTQLIERAIQQTRRVESEAQEEMSMSGLMREVYLLVRRYGEATVGRILLYPGLKPRFPLALIREALAKMLEEGLIEVSGSLADPGTLVRVRVPKRGAGGGVPAE